MQYSVLSTQKEFFHRSSIQYLVLSNQKKILHSNAKTKIEPASYQNSEITNSKIEVQGTELLNKNKKAARFGAAQKRQGREGN